VKLTCLVDNSVKQSSPLWGEHGLSMLLETPQGRLLFDTGASGTVLVHNLLTAGIETRTFTACALSHGHADHTGGMADLLERRPGLPIYGNATLLRERFAMVEGSANSIGPRMRAEDLQRQADLKLSASPQQILPGVWTTGVISVRTEAEGRGTNHVIRAPDGNGYVPDPYEDDLSLVIERPQGWALVCGCCHAGLLNTLEHVRRVFGAVPSMVVGGTHLVTADPAQLSHVVEVLGRLGPPMLYLNHCTGPTGLLALSTCFSRRVAPFPAGSTLEL